MPEICSLHSEIMIEIKTDLKELKAAVIGDVEHQGIVGRLIDGDRRLIALEKWQTEKESLINKIVWRLAGIALLGGASGVGLTKIVEALIK